MIQPPPMPPSQQSYLDADHLRGLAIGHYVLAGLTALTSCFPMIHVGMGIAIVTGKIPMHGPGGPDGRMFGWVLIGMGSLIIILGFALACLMFLTARWLSARKNRNFCFVVACVECLFMPLGTILGIFTIMVLQRPGVIALFNAPETQNPWSRR